MPHGLTIDAHGNSWVTDVGSHQVHKLDKDFKVSREGEGGLFPEEITQKLFSVNYEFGRKACSRDR